MNIELERALEWVREQIEDCCDQNYKNNANGYSECDCDLYPCRKVLAERLLKSIDNSN